MWESTKVSMPVLSKKNKVALQSVETYANEAWFRTGLRALGPPRDSSGKVAGKSTRLNSEYAGLIEYLQLRTVTL